MKIDSTATKAVRKISLVIPFFNEEESIRPLVARLGSVLRKIGARWRAELVLVDDGSTDNTYALLLDQFNPARLGNVIIVRHMKNRGLGAAMRSGFEAATGDIICTLDSDCSYAPEDMPRLIDLLVECGADVATASPYHPDGAVENVPAWRLALSMGASRLYAMLLSTRIHCFTSFFRAYRREWARPDLSNSDGFLAVTETLVSAAVQGAKIVELPVLLGAREFGRSKMQVASVMREHLRLLSRIAMSDWKMKDNHAAEADAAWSSLTTQESGEIIHRWVLVGRAHGGAE